MTLADQPSTGAISADRDRCVGAGQCVLAAPAVFDQDEDGLVLVLDERPSASPSDSVRAAVQACPSGAVSLRQAPGPAVVRG